MYLWALRITGTGVTGAPSSGSTPIAHPKIISLTSFSPGAQACRLSGGTLKNVLNSEEFAARTIGAIAFAGSGGDEVWGMARIYDTDAAVNLSTRQLSTSPR